MIDKDPGITFHELIGKNKVIVTKFPEHCSLCPFVDGVYFTFKCLITEREQDDYDGMKRIRGCPLRLKAEKQSK